MEYSLNTDITKQLDIGYEQWKNNKLSVDDLISYVTRTGGDFFKKTEFSKKTPTENDIVDLRSRIKSYQDLTEKIGNIIEVKGKEFKGKNSLEKIRNLSLSLEGKSIKKLEKYEGEVYPPLNLLVTSDIDSEDTNGAIAIEVIQAIIDGVPQLTTVNLLNRANEFYKEQSDQINESMKNFKVYREKKGNLVFLLPKDRDDLSKLGIDKNSVEEIKYVKGNIFTEKSITSNSPFISSFKSLFLENSPCDKRFLFSGHGRAGLIAGFLTKNFKDIFAYINKPNFKCKYVDISCCCLSGNQSNLYVKDFNSKQQNPSFPVVIRSITEGPTYGVPIKNAFDNFDKYEELTLKEKIEPIYAMALVQGASKCASQSPQILLPSDKPTRFQVIPRKDELIYDIFSTRVLNKESIKTDSLIVGLHLLSVKAPLTISKSSKTTNHEYSYGGLKTVIRDPILNSFVSGSSQHFIKELTLEKNKLSNLFTGTEIFHREFGSNKGFFIAKVKDEQREYSNVVISYTKGKMSMLYSFVDNNQRVYVRTDGRNKEILEKEEYKRQVSEALILTRGDREAIELSTDSTQTVESFMEDMKEFFVDVETKKPLFIENLEESLKVLANNIKDDAQFFINMSRKKQLALATKLIGINVNYFDILPKKLQKHPMIQNTLYKLKILAFKKPEDVEDILKILAIDGTLIQYVSKELLNNEKISKDILLKAVKQNGLALQFIPLELQDKDVIMAAIRNNPKALQFVDKDKMDRDVIVLAYGEEKRTEVIQFFPEEYQKAMMQKNIKLLAHASEKIKNDSDFHMELFSENKESFKYFPQDKQKEYILRKPKLLGYASDEIKKDTEFLKKMKAE